MQHEEEQERRSKKATRVELNTRVEICGRDKSTRPFEAHSVEVSGRGMQIHARNLPQVGAPLVLRFEHDGREVVVEGDVAWCREGKKGGDFGVKFTAIDGQSVIALKEICATQAAAARASEEEQSTPEASVSEAVAFDSRVQFGSPVKLHIEGLAAPMKARVVDANEKRLKVGSKLDFLRLGQGLAMEDITSGERRNGQVHAVSVQIDPESQIPQLVVSVRYDGADELTPQPTVVDAKGKRRKANAERSKQRADNEALDDTLDEALDDEDSEEHDDELDEDEEYYAAEARFKGRIAAFVGKAAGAVQTGARTLSHGAGVLASGVRGVTQRGLDSLNEEKAPPRRTTRAATQVSVTPNGVQRRVNKNRVSQSAPSRANSGQVVSLGQRLKQPAPLVAIAAATLLGGYFLFRSDPKSEYAAQATALVTSPSAVPNAPANFPAPAPLGNQPGSQLGNQLGSVPNNQPGALAQAPKGIVANVPLFGPTTLANTEPAPVSPGPARGGVDEYSLSRDQAFDDAPVRNNPAQNAAKIVEEKATNEPTAFRFGRLQEPRVYRLRLDAPGVALQGEKTASGYTVLVPGRKAMETGAAILQSENRLKDVRVSSGPAGTKIVFRFDKEPPNFKARLRSDYIEFYINPPPPAPSVKSVKRR